MSGAQRANARLKYRQQGRGRYGYDREAGVRLSGAQEDPDRSTRSKNGSTGGTIRSNAAVSGEALDGEGNPDAHRLTERRYDAEHGNVGDGPYHELSPSGGRTTGTNAGAVAHSLDSEHAVEQQRSNARQAGGMGIDRAAEAKERQAAADRLSGRRDTPEEYRTTAERVADNRDADGV